MNVLKSSHLIPMLNLLAFSTGLRRAGETSLWLNITSFLLRAVCDHPDQRPECSGLAP
ncbi:MAG TPA: hypothetical protein PLI60_10710 [Anaerolineaceae bacterium]|nr:hypothetical protein [Anaerolineaceae bacterium]